MIRLECSAEKWSNKYSIPINKEMCRKCGIEVEVNIPVMTKDFVGFESEIHECGEGYRISILKPLIGEEHE